MTPLASLIAANIAFVGSHFVMSHPMRAGLVRAVGAKGFLGVYSLVSLALFAWIVMAFRQVGPGGEVLWDGTSTVIWTIASLLTVLAMVLLLGSFKGNPAVPDAPASLAEAEPAGALRVTRHPMMWGVAIWAVSHMLVMPTPRTLVTAGAMLVLALLGAHLQDGKKEGLMGEAWKGWESRTSFWPRWSALGAIPVTIWLAGIAAWLLATWLHVWLAYVPAGIWRSAL
jgi:uncharacterized membrane protein